MKIELMPISGNETEVVFGGESNDQRVDEYDGAKSFRWCLPIC
jgi:hypothetical protein